VQRGFRGSCYILDWNAIGGLEQRESMKLLLLRWKNKKGRRRCFADAGCRSGGEEHQWPPSSGAQVEHVPRRRAPPGSPGSRAITRCRRVSLPVGERAE
jgi:hypothetical protein